MSERRLVLLDFTHMSSTLRVYEADDTCAMPHICQTPVLTGGAARCQCMPKHRRPP